MSNIHEHQIYDALDDKERARLEGQSVEANKAEGDQAKRKFNELLNQVPYDQEKGMYNFGAEALKEKGCELSPGEVKAQLAKANTYMSEIRKINNAKLDAENKRLTAEMEIPGREQRAERAMTDSNGQIVTLGEYFAKVGGHELRPIKDYKAGNSFEDEINVDLGEIYNTFTTGGAPSAGVTPRSPKATNMVTEALELRGGLAAILPVYQMPNAGSEFIYDREAESGITQASGYGKAENAAAVSQDVGAQTYTQKLVKRIVHTAYTNETIEDLPAGSGVELIRRIIARLLAEDLEYQLINGQNAGQAGLPAANAADFNGLLGRGTGTNRGGQAGLTFTRVTSGNTPQAEADDLLMLNNAFDAYEAPRNASSNPGNSMSPTHIVMSNSYARKLTALRSVGDSNGNGDGQYYFPNALTSGLNEIYGARVIRSDFLESTNGGVAMLFNNSEANLGVAFKRGITERVGLDGSDLKSDRQSIVWSYRGNLICKRPRSVLSIRNLGRISGYTA